MGNAANLDLPPPMRPATRSICGFWRRVVALLIDSLVLGVIGMILGSLFFDELAHLGMQGRWIGFTIGLLYLGLLNSSVGHGQTFGKKLMKIEVVDRKGLHISVERSFIRYCVLCIPFFLNGVYFSPSTGTSILGSLLSLIVLGGGGTIAYLYIFNRRTRQSLHDISVGTYVVHSDGHGEVLPAAIRRTHFVVASGWCVLVAGITLAAPYFAKAPVASKLWALQSEVLKTGRVQALSILVGKNWQNVSGKSHTTSFIAATARMAKRPADFRVAADEIARVILVGYPEAEESDMLIVNVIYGYDIGIAYAWKRQSFQHPPGEWRGIVGVLQSI